MEDEGTPISQAHTHCTHYSSPALGLFSFRVLRCVSRHISTPVYQSFYHLTTAPSPPSEGKQEVPTHTQTPVGGSVEGVGVGGGVVDLM